MYFEGVKSVNLNRDVISVFCQSPLDLSPQRVGSNVLATSCLNGADSVALIEAPQVPLDLNPVFDLKALKFRLYLSAHGLRVHLLNQNLGQIQEQGHLHCDNDRSEHKSRQVLELPKVNAEEVSPQFARAVETTAEYQQSDRE